LEFRNEKEGHADLFQSQGSGFKLPPSAEIQGVAFKWDLSKAPATNYVLE
jgi:hypothetical protein